MDQALVGMEEKRIFAFGSGRSGTTLLAKLLDASPLVLYRHEPDKVRPSHDVPYLPEAGDYPKLSQACAVYLDQLYAERLPSVVGKRPEFEKAYRSAKQAWLHSALIKLLGVAEKFALRIPVPDLIDGDHVCHVVKSVNSVCRVPMFNHSEPGIRFVHIVRHPGAVAASVIDGVKKGLMGEEVHLSAVSRLAISKSFELDTEVLASSSYATRSAYVWMVQNEKTFREMTGCDNYLLVSYEDLCVNMKMRTQEICDFAGIPFDSQIERFVDSMQTNAGDSHYFSVNKNPIPHVSGWERKMASPLVDEITDLIGKSQVGSFVLDKYNEARSAVGMPIS